LKTSEAVLIMNEVLFIVLHTFIYRYPQIASIETSLITLTSLSFSKINGEILFIINTCVFTQIK